MLTNTTSGAEASEAVLARTVRHKGPWKTLMPSVLASGRKLTPFVRKINSCRLNI
jgi:hypothetical protein